MLADDGHIQFHCESQESVTEVQSSRNEFDSTDDQAQSTSKKRRRSSKNFNISLFFRLYYDYIDDNDLVQETTKKLTSSISGKYTSSLVD